MKKKILFIGTMLGIMFTPIVSIAVSFETVLSKIPKLEEWHKAPGTNITNGYRGTIFQASNGDLYAMGNETNLQVLKNGATRFEKAPGTNITNGFRGTIFQASNGDLYTMGHHSSLQVLKVGKKSFIPALGANISNGVGGTIFQANNGDLYVMGSESSLQVLKVGKKSFIPAPGTNIIHGINGTIFQAKNGDLYAMGRNANLQVLKQGTDHFEDAPGANIPNGIHGTIFQASNGDLYVMGWDAYLQVLKQGTKRFEKASKTNINDGTFGTIFQASNGDLYAMASESKLEVLKQGTNHFEKAFGSNILNGVAGTIFQASNGDLYAMGSKTNLQVLKVGKKSFILALGADISSGSGGTIFQASNGDIYVMGDGSSLQVLKQGTKRFENVPGTNINNGQYGTIFQASNGDLYAMGKGTSLQVLKNNLEFEITSETFHGKNDGTIKAKNFINYYSKLQYKNNLASKWIDFPSNGKITNIPPGTYNFRWVGKNGETYTDDSLVVNLLDQIIKTFLKTLIIKSNEKIQEVSLTTVTAPTKKIQVNYGVAPKLDDLTPPTQSDFSFTFKSATTINEVGQSKVTYIVDVVPKVVGTTTKEIIFMIDGFETKVIANANTRIQNVAIETAIAPTMKTKVNYGVAPKLNDLSPPTQSGFSFTFTRATTVNDKGQSKVTYIVDVVPKVAGTTTKEIIFTINGFETKVIANANTKIQNVAIETVTAPTMKTQVNYGVAPKLDDLTAPTQSGFSFTFKSATAINNKGQSKVTYIVDVDPKVVGTTTKEIIFVINGFETKDAKVDANNPKIILVIIISIGLISLGVIIWWTNRFFFKFKKILKKN